MPPPRGQPQRVGAVTASRVQGPAGAQILGLGDEVSVWGAMGNLIGVLAQDLRPALFPEVSVVGGWGHERADDCSSGPAGLRRRGALPAILTGCTPPAAATA